MSVPAKTCAACGADAHLQAERCPSCGHAFVPPDPGIAPAGPVRAPAGYEVTPAAGQGARLGTNEPYAAKPIRQKSKVIAALLALFLGGTGAHGFYLGNRRMGFTILAVNLLGIPLLLIGVGVVVIGAVSLLCFVQTFVYLIRSEADFYQDYVVEKRWL
ncbi:MAG: TM2 domain-containing protein [Armatimonadetes bacterium]|nr:TM2 domain-containing protein [Armatimonadota bacterium]MDE2207728.1 TM2 domain-containing protein [Armatimonadota bacterium]